MGVMAPSQRVPVNASRYRLPQNTTIPAVNSHPAAAHPPPPVRPA